MQQHHEFLLIHGSWHTGACWRHVEAVLQANGHKTHAITLPGHGDGTTDVSLEKYVQAIVDYVDAAALDKFVLVGHSAGGTIVCKAAEQLGDKIARLVLISPLLAKDGEALTQAVPPAYADLFAQMAAANGNNQIMVPWEVWRDSFIGDASEEVARAAFDELCPEPFGPLTEAVDLSKFAQLPIAKSYIRCMEDVVFPVGEFGLFPRMYEQIAPCRLVNVQGSHELMYSNPDALADALIKAGRA